MWDVRCGVLSWQRKRKAKGIFGGSSQQLVIERIPQNDFKTHLAKYYKMGWEELNNFETGWQKYDKSIANVNRIFNASREHDKQLKDFADSV